MACAVEMEIITMLRLEGTDLDKKVNDSLPARSSSISEASTSLL